MENSTYVTFCDAQYYEDKEAMVLVTNNNNTSSARISFSASDVINASLIGTSSAVMAAMLMKLLLISQRHQCSSNILELIEINRKTLMKVIFLVVLFLVCPVIFVLILLALFYKLICLVVIQHKDKRFVKFLDSFDVFWSLEDDNSKSIINVLGIVETDASHLLVENIKKKLFSVINDVSVAKIFYRRKEQYGFYYWRKYSNIDMEQYVKTINFAHRHLKTKDLENIMTAVTQEPLPYEDQGLFQILVTEQSLSQMDERKKYAVIFRVHHSVGDGVALIHLLCRSLAASENISNVNLLKLAPETNYKSPLGLMKMIKKLIEIPTCFVKGIIRKPDVNSLHGPKLTGRKIYKWTKSDENLFVKVKKLKDHFDQSRFGDILATALAEGLRNYFLKTMTTAPEDLAVVIPVRLTNNDITTNMKLENDFSVTILDLPIKNNNLYNIQGVCNEMRNGADPLTNYYFLKLVGSVFPNNILRPLLNSSQATLIFSNMPGPDVLELGEGNLLKEMVFFVPHKGNTGLGVTALCYGGVLRFAAMADEAIISTGEQLSYILDGMTEHIDLLYKKYMLN